MSGLVKRLGIIIFSSMLIFSILLLYIPQTSNAEEATSIEITEELSRVECYPGDALWVNGTAQYDNSTFLKDSEVLIQIKENEMKWTTSTDSNGGYKKQITAVGRFIDQKQSNVSEITHYVHSTNRVGQTFRPNFTKIHSLDIYVIKSLASSSSSLTVHMKNSPSAITDIGNATLEYKKIEDGWNNFAFTPPIELIPGDEYFILLTSNDTAGGYENHGNAYFFGPDYENGTVYWEGDPMISDEYQDIGFITYYEEPLEPGEYTINVSVTGSNNTGPLYGYNEAILTVVPRPTPDLHLSDENLSLIFDNDPPLEGNIILINATVVNQGDAVASNFFVNFSLDSETNVFDSQSVTIDPFSEEVISTLWTAEVGDHTIFVTADSSEIIPEKIETNNNASINIFVDGDNDQDGIGNLSDDDDDNDGYTDVVEKAEGTDPLDASSKPADNDGDFLPDSMDPDDDNDGYTDTIESIVETDPFDNSSVPDDFDGDWMPDSLDLDIDNDGVPNDDDVFPYNCSEWLDTDGDGVGDNTDNDDDADGLLDDEDAYPLDTDNDGLNNDIDWDDDADGILDWEDSRPLDTDNDGLTNDVDNDDDGDRLSDSEEEKMRTNPLKSDTDGDGVNDKKDFDPLDSGVTSDPGIPILYFLVPGSVILLIILLAFLASRRGTRIRVAGVGAGYRELPALSEKLEAPSEPRPSEEYIPTVSDKLREPIPDALAGLEEEIEEPSPKDELAGLDEEIEEPSSLEQKDELADIEEEFEEPYSPPPKEVESKKEDTKKTSKSKKK